MGGRPGGPSTYGECFGALSWHIHEGHADGVDLSALRTVLSIRYFDRVQPSTPWEVVLYVDEGAGDEQRSALADIFLGRAGGTVARLYGPAIGEVRGMGLIQGLSLASLGFVLTVQMFRAMNPALEEASQVHGMGFATTMRRIS